MSDFNWNDFDASDKQYDSEFAPIPADWYVVAIAKAESKPTKTGGMRLALECEVLDGPFKGRKVFAGLNLINPNPKAQEIGKQELASVCRALGIVHPKSPSALIGKPLRAKVAIQPETADYPAQNTVKAWEPARSAAPATTPNQIPTDEGSKPWIKR